MVSVLPARTGLRSHSSDPDEQRANSTAEQPSERTHAQRRNKDKRRRQENALGTRANE